MVRGIRAAVAGSRLVGFARCRCRCKPMSVQPAAPRINGKLRGQRVEQVTRLAKRIVFTFEQGDRLVIEPRMTGLILLSDPPDRQHLRLEWKFEGAEGPFSVWFWDRRGLGTARLYRESDFRDRLGPSAIGPDALEMTLSQWRAGCSRTRRAIKVALLDQRLVAGIGNLYASEILHTAGIHPTTPADQLTSPQTRRLMRATQSILQNAILHEGSTLSDGTYRNALNQTGNYQNAHRVYARQGDSCPSCQQAEIVRCVQAQRSTFFCPLCQPAPDLNEMGHHGKTRS